jgi:hypothetical protein
MATISEYQHWWVAIRNFSYDMAAETTIGELLA